MKKGNLIVVEGACDGIGKTTQCALLHEHLVKDNERVVKHHFPSYETFQGKGVEKYLSGEFGTAKDLSPYFVNALYATDRSITWYLELKKYYDEGATLLFDRYTTSSIIYQSTLIDGTEKKKEFINWVIDYEYNKLQIPSPDNVIFLHAPFELATRIRMARVQNDGIEKDIHEKDLAFMKKVYDNSTFIANYLNWDVIECSKNNEMRSIDDIHKDVYKLVRKK